MNGYDYVRSMNQYYRPRTPTAAMRAMETGLLPPEAFIYRATAVHTLMENPDPTEIERVLARPDNDLDTNLLLVRILERLLNSTDSETALFAAESINAIENRYNKRIESLRRELDQTGNERLHSDIACSFYELGIINRSRPAITRFYLAEAHSHIRELRSSGIRLRKTDALLLIDILVELKLYDQAAESVKIFRKQRPKDPDYAFAAARVAYYTGTYQDVAAALAVTASRRGGGPREETEIVATWRGEG